MLDLHAIALSELINGFRQAVFDPGTRIAASF